MNTTFDRPKLYNPVKRRISPVTAIIGFACKDAVILASDSQITQDNRKMVGKKIFEIRFAGKRRAIVAIAGYLSGASLFIEKFEEMAKDVEIKTERSICDVAELAMKFSKEKILASFREKEISDKERLIKLNNNSCSVILAYVFNKTPYIFTLDTESVWGHKSTTCFEVDGTGGTLAEHTMKGQKLKEMPYESAVGLAVYAVEASKRTDLNCSGDVQAAFLKCDESDGGICKTEWISGLASAVSQTHETITNALVHEIQARFKTTPDTDDWSE